MKRLMIIMFLTAACGSGFAGIIEREYNMTYNNDLACYSERLDIYQVRTDFLLFDPGYVKWEHTNPAVLPYGTMTEQGYADMCNNGNITEAKLTIVVDDLDKDDSVKVAIKDACDNWQDLGYLNKMTFSDCFGVIPGPDAHAGHRTTTTFDLNPCWIDANLPVVVKLSGWLLNPNQVEFETSTLSIKAVPVPGSILLSTLGMSIVGYLKRRKTI